jgi:pimeloyl-ACP methyl ester carboxylesterase
MTVADLTALARLLTDRGTDLHPGFIKTQDHARLRSLEARPPTRSAERPPVVMLHGFCSSLGQMLGVARGLQQRHRVVLYDARGHGKSTPFRDKATMAQLADDLAEVLDATGAPIVDVVGLSMGAQTIFELVRRHGTSRLGKVVLIDQGPRLLPEAGYEHALFGGMKVVEVREFLQDLQHRPRRLGLAWARGIWRSREPLAARLFVTPGLLAGLPGVPTATLQLAADMIGQDWREVVPRIDRPTLLCYGGRSMYPDAGRWMHANLPKAKLEWFAESGHGLSYQEPVRLARVIARFLAPDGGEAW